METTTMFAAMVTDNLSTFSSPSNMTDSPGKASPSPAASRYPPDYFVVPADVMFNFRLAIYSTFIPVTALIGLVGNSISFLVLLRHKMPKTTKMVLLAITVYDFLNLITAILLCLIGLAIAYQYEPGITLARKAFQIFGNYLQFVFGRISSLLIVVISLERFCAVFFPFKIKTIWSPKVMACSIIFCNIFAFVFFIPRAMEMEPVDIPIPNSTEVKTILVLTELGKNRQFFATFYSWNQIVWRIIPILMVIACNVAISARLYLSRTQRQQMTSMKADDDQRITRTLLTLSLVYLACMLPNAVIIIIQIFDYDRPFPYSRNNAYVLASILFYWFEVINSTVNFIIYIFSSEKMREDFKDVVGCGSRRSSSKYRSESKETGLSMATVSATVD